MTFAELWGSLWDWKYHWTGELGSHPDSATTPKTSVCLSLHSGSPVGWKQGNDPAHPFWLWHGCFSDLFLEIFKLQGLPSIHMTTRLNGPWNSVRWQEEGTHAPWILWASQCQAEMTIVLPVHLPFPSSSLSRAPYSSPLLLPSPPTNSPLSPASYSLSGPGIFRIWSPSGLSEFIPTDIAPAHCPLSSPVASLHY